MKRSTGHPDIDTVTSDWALCALPNAAFRRNSWPANWFQSSSWKSTAQLRFLGFFWNKTFVCKKQRFDSFVEKHVQIRSTSCSVVSTRSSNFHQFS